MVLPRGSRYLIIKELRLKDHDYSGFWGLNNLVFGPSGLLLVGTEACSTSHATTLTTGGMIS